MKRDSGTLGASLVPLVVLAMVLSMVLAGVRPAAVHAQEDLPRVAVLDFTGFMMGTAARR
jgi:hypothetical protein